MSDSLTPMMRQYRKMKAELPPNTILFFRLGDFYEMFFEDAIEAARILDIALTKRHKVPMCGVPHHSHESYLARLIRAGKKVAVCDQMENPATAKGIVRREVTSVLTPGAVLTDQVLDAQRNNYLAGLFQVNGVYGLAFLDLSTGVFWGEESRDADTLRDNLLRYAPAECVLPAGMADDQSAQSSPASPLRALLGANTSVLVSPYDDWTFEHATAYDTLVRHFGVQSLDGFGSEGHPAIIGAAGGVLHYVKNALRRNLEHVRQLRVRNPDDFLVMDEATRMNLDLVAARGLPRISADGTGHPGRGIAGTLLDVLDNTKTAMGGRLLREWILRPLVREEDIRRRHDAVEAFCGQRSLLRSLQESLAGVRDMERGIARLGAGNGNARDVRALGQSLEQLPVVRKTLAGQTIALLSELAKSVTPLPDLVSLINRAIVDEPPITIKEGGIIRRDYQAELDVLRDAATQGKSWLAEY